MSSNRPFSYARAGVDTGEADSAIGGLVSILQSIDTGAARRSVLGPGHYANVLAIDDKTGIAVATDGVGTKLIIAQQMNRFDTVGIDCVAMNVNDLICIGAKPIALVDYLAVEQINDEMLREIATGLKSGAESAGIEIPGGELAQVAELIRGHPSPHGFDLVGSSFGTVDLNRIVTGEKIEPGDTIIGLPSSGIHSNGVTLARKALFEKAGYTLEDSPGDLQHTLGEELLQPTHIYVDAVLELLDSGRSVSGLAHITGGGLDNLLRLNPEVGYKITDPLPVPPIFTVIQEAGSVEDDEMFRVFNMGCGFCCIVPDHDHRDALAGLQHHFPNAKVIGSVTDAPGEITLTGAGNTEGHGDSEN